MSSSKENTIITEKFLLSLGFKREDVNKEDSGGEPYHYFTFKLKDIHGEEITMLISNANTECIIENNYKVEFFDYDTIGYIDNKYLLVLLLDFLKNLKKQ
jgi:hypothetical protein